MEDKYIWIENIKSFSGRHRLKGDVAIGASLWYPDFFEEAYRLNMARSGEKVYHFLNMEYVIGFSIILADIKRQKYKTKAQKRVAYLESTARGIKVCARDDLSQSLSLQLCDYQRVGEPFCLDKIITSKNVIKEFMSSEHKDEFEYLISEFSRGSLLIRLSFPFWLFLLSLRGCTI